MTEKETANRLYKKYKSLMFIPDNPVVERQYNELTKECCLVCVDEILNQTRIVIDRPECYKSIENPFWKKVRIEIEKL